MSQKESPVAEIAPLEHQEIEVIEPPISKEDWIEEYAVDCTLDVLRSFENVSKIVNDEGMEVDFSGKEKEQFLEFLEEGFAMFHEMMYSIHGLGEFLTEVRAALKPRKLFMTWLNYAGLPSSTAYQYLRLHDRYKEELPQYSAIGVKKLLAVAKLPDCQDYMRNNAQEIALKPATDVIREVKNELQKGTKKGKGGRKPLHEVFKGVVIRSSGDGTRIGLENLPKNTQKEVVVAIKTALSQLIP